MYGHSLYLFDLLFSRTQPQPEGGVFEAARGGEGLRRGGGGGHAALGPPWPGGGRPQPRQPHVTPGGCRARGRGSLHSGRVGDAVIQSTDNKYL